MSILQVILAEQRFNGLAKMLPLTCSLRTCMLVLHLAHRISLHFRYAQSQTVCAIILHVITTLHFCQTLEHSHEIVAFSATHLQQKLF